ncbi:hypothetical protein HZH68_013846 [Vespula germanica]|uniref:Uncharacterized protein n=2 Tax=Vespula TaxID=7451 RepID=A0A834JBF1_VESGE|nr:hypothetical protein HZH66_012491 [Vespula vulgaris]KAF7385416.1 hypothetical protein HZH68_013846 [Vespula germanica]
MDQATDSQVRISHRLDVEEKEEEEKEEEEEEGEEKEGVLFVAMHYSRTPPNENYHGMPDYLLPMGSHHGVALMLLLND